MKMKTVIRNLWYKFQLWRINAKWSELDMDMMCTTMTYKEYCEESELLKSEQKSIEDKLCKSTVI